MVRNHIRKIILSFFGGILCVMSSATHAAYSDFSTASSGGGPGPRVGSEGGYPSANVPSSQTFCGCYGGAWGGVNQSMGTYATNNSLSLQAPPVGGGGVDNAQVGVLNAQNTTNSGTGGLRLGVGAVVSNYLYLGAEAGAGVSRGTVTANSSYNGLASNPKGKLRSNEASIDFTPGIMLGGIKLFGRAGVGINRMQLRSNPSVNTTINTFEGVPVTLTYLYSTPSTPVNKTRTALRLGVGLSHFIYDNLALELNYIFTNYGSVTAYTNVVVPAQQDPTLSRTFTDTTTFKLRSQTVTVGLNYFFSGLFSPAS